MYERIPPRCVNLVGTMLSRWVRTSNHHDGHLTCLKIVFVSSTSIRPNEGKREIDLFWHPEAPGTLLQSLLLIPKGTHHPEHMLILPAFEFYANVISYYVSVCGFL